MFMPKLIVATSVLALAASGPGALVTPARGFRSLEMSPQMALVSARTVADDRCTERGAAQPQTGKGGDARADCTASAVLYASEPKPVTRSDLKLRASDLPTDAAREMLDAADDGSLQSREFRQQINNITDAETQRGTFFFDGSRVWVTDTTDGMTGTHICQVDWAAGYAVNNVWCGEGGSDAQRDLFAQWSFSLVMSGSPIRWDETYALHVGADGSIWQ